MFASEHLARSAKTGNNLVGDEQTSVTVANFPKARPVVGSGDHGAHRAGNGLSHHRRHGLGALELDHFLHRLNAPVRALFGSGAAVLAAIGIGLRHVETSCEQRFVVGFGKDRA